MRILFWNTHRRSLTAELASLAVAHAPDVVGLAENPTASATLAAALGGGYRELSAVRSRVRVFTRLPAAAVGTIVADKRFVMVPLTTARRGTVLLVVAHLSSKLFGKSAATQQEEAGDLAEQIVAREQTLGTELTILIGDLNLDPFDPGLVDARGLHAVMSRAVATRVRGRRVRRTWYPMFYNPMWSHMGDGWERPAGTYWFDTGNVDRHYFHTLDHVLVRPGLIPALLRGEITVLRRGGSRRFTSAADDRPLKGSVSDHLPIHLDIPL